MFPVVTLKSGLRLFLLIAVTIVLVNELQKIAGGRYVDISFWLPLSIGMLGAFGAFLWRSALYGAKIVELLTVLKEKISLCQVGIEALRLVDTDTVNKSDILEQRIDDLERWLQLTTQGQDHPFVIRDRSSRKTYKN